MKLDQDHFSHNFDSRRDLLCSVHQKLLSECFFLVLSSLFFFFAATLLRTTVRKQCKRLKLTTRKGSSTRSAHSCHHSQLVTVIPHDLMDRRDGPLCSCGDAIQQGQSIRTCSSAPEHGTPPAHQRRVSSSFEQFWHATDFRRSQTSQKWAVSSENRPPTSPPRTTSRALPSAPASSGYRLSFRVRARTNDAPFSVAHLGFATPSRVNGHTRVVSMASCAPRNRGKPSTTTSSLRSSTLLNTGKSRSRTKTFVLTLPPASRQIRAATFSSGNPRRPNTPATGHADRWWPRQSSRRPHRQERTVRGKG